MSRESIAFLKKWQDRQRRKRSGKCPKSHHFDHCSFQPKMMALWLQREAKLCFKFFLEAVSVLKTERRAGGSLTRRRKLIQKTWLWKYSLLKQFTKRNSIFLWRANWPTFPCQTARMGTLTPKGLIATKMAEHSEAKSAKRSVNKNYLN